jgi:hypothetical protein
LVGIVEQGGAPGKQAFTCLEDLWGILDPPKNQDSMGKQKTPKPKKKGELHVLEKDR